jgi:adenylate cyclase class 2
MGAILTQPRTYEINLRFDTPSGDLSSGYRVLRLREDLDARLTYKGPGTLSDGARVRQEIEFTVGDFQAAQAFLEALGYQVVLVYEKYRTIYDVGRVHVTLDEMPFGCFSELEGETPQEIIDLGERLGLNWERRVLDSYTMLFERYKQSQNLDLRDLTFENFDGRMVTPDMLSVQPGDER